MELILKAKLHNVFKAKDYADAETGQIKTKGKWQMQFIEEVESAEGVQLVVHKISVPEINVLAYQGLVGEVIEIPVKTFVNKGKVGYYGI